MAAPTDISPEALLELLDALTAKGNQRRRRLARLRQVSLVAVIFALFAAGAFSALHFLRRHPSHTAAATVHRQPASSPVTTAPLHTTPAPVAVNQHPRAAGIAVLTVRATRGSSWLMAREDDASGRLLYQGVLKTGQSTTLRGRRVWVRFGASSYLDLRLNGKSIRLEHVGTVDAVFTRAGAASPTAG